MPTTIECNELTSIKEALEQAGAEFQAMDRYDNLNDFILAKDTLENLYYATELVKGILRGCKE